MTYKQKLAASKMVENGGNLGKAMLEAGYSKAMAKNPYKLTRSKGWIEATQDLFSDEKLLEKHSELLDSVKTLKLSFPVTTKDEEIHEVLSSISENKIVYIKQVNGFKTCIFTTPDNSVQFNALNLAYRVKGYFNNNKNNRRVDDESLNDEVERIRNLLAGK